MPAKRWSLDSLESACRAALLSRATLRLKELPLSRSADVEWVEPAGRARVRVDHHEVGLRTGTIHELLHVVLSEALGAFDDGLGEEIILAFESRLDQRISVSKRRAAWWRKAINEKLPK